MWSRAVLDANVLFPMRLCDTLLTIAEAGMFAPLWSEAILDEMERNLVAQRRTTAERARNRRREMGISFPNATITGYESLVPAMQNDPGDRHVLAAAAHAKADVIVTQNRRHFPDAALAPFGVTAQSADDFLLALLADDANTLIGVLRAQATRLTRPPQSVAQLLTRLEAETPQFVRKLFLALRDAER